MKTNSPVEYFSENPATVKDSTLNYKSFLFFIRNIADSAVYLGRTFSVFFIHREAKNRCDSILTVGRFIKRCCHEIFDEALTSKFKDSSAVNYTWVEADTSALLIAAKRKIKKVGKVYRFRQIEITKIEDKDNHQGVYLDFIETKTGYKFYGCGYYGNKSCCAGR